MTTRITIVGAGIIGLATARAIKRRLPEAAVTVVDKASTVAAHQSGHNSGVLHSGDLLHARLHAGENLS